MLPHSYYIHLPPTQYNIINWQASFSLHTHQESWRMSFVYHKRVHNKTTHLKKRNASSAQAIHSLYQTNGAFKIMLLCPLLLRSHRHAATLDSKQRNFHYYRKARQKLEWGVGTLWNTDCSMCGCSVYRVLPRAPSKEFKTKYQRKYRNIQGMWACTVIGTVTKHMLLVFNWHVEKCASSVTCYRSQRNTIIQMQIDHYSKINLNAFLHNTIKQSFSKT